MNKNHLLGIDIGTTSTKVVLLDPDGKILADVFMNTGLNSPFATWSEENPHEWWENVCRLIPESMRLAGLTPGDIAAVGLSGMVPALVLLDEEGRVIRPSIQQSDARAGEEIIYFQNHTDAGDILKRTGSAVTQQSIGPKFLWLTKHEPEKIARTCHVMGSYDYIVYRLTGKFSIERNWAFESGLYDFIREDWDNNLLKLAGIQREWLGEVHLPTDIVGTVTSAAAEQAGLLVGTPVVAGSADHIASALSAGVKSEGEMLVKLGGSGDLLYCVNQPMVDERLYLDYHDIPGKFIFNGCMASSGSLLKWFQREFAHGALFEDLDAAADVIPAGSDGLILLPYFLGEKTPLNDPSARGTLVGLTLSHTNAHVFRAVLEGVAYGFYHHLEVLEERGLKAYKARVTNGGAKSKLWKQITADVLGIPLEHIRSHPGSSLGAGFIAGKGVGVFREWEDAERFIEISMVSEPDQRKHEKYVEKFKMYREIYEALKNIYPKL